MGVIMGGQLKGLPFTLPGGNGRIHTCSISQSFVHPKHLSNHLHSKGKGRLPKNPEVQTK
eukprot:4350161-Amphidinium_carterae.1